MGFAVTQGFEQGTNPHVVTVRVTLTMAETNRLFLSGDTLLSWPPGEVRKPGEPEPIGPGEAQDMTLNRTGMFISEVARLAHGLKIGYRQAAEAQRAAQLVRIQLVKAGIGEEC